VVPRFGRATTLSRFDELSRREAARTAILYAFDLIEHDGEDLRNLPFLDRKDALARLLRDAKAGILCPAMNSRRLICNPQGSKLAHKIIEFQPAPVVWSLIEFTNRATTERYRPAGGVERASVRQSAGDASPWTGYLDLAGRAVQDGSMVLARHTPPAHACGLALIECPSAFMTD
jgi:hypothetical protein